MVHTFYLSSFIVHGVKIESKDIMALVEKSAQVPAKVCLPLFVYNIVIPISCLMRVHYIERMVIARLLICLFIIHVRYITVPLLR